MSVFKPNRVHKTFSSRLKRWADRLLPFDFEVVPVAGGTLVMTAYSSIHPSKIEGVNIKAELLWNEWFTVNIVNSLIDILAGSLKASGRSKGQK